MYLGGSVPSGVAEGGWTKNKGLTCGLGPCSYWSHPSDLNRGPADYKTEDIFDIQGLRYTSYDSSLRIYNVQKEIEEISKNLSETFNQREGRNGTGIRRGLETRRSWRIHRGTDRAPLFPGSGDPAANVHPAKARTSQTALSCWHEQRPCPGQASAARLQECTPGRSGVGTCGACGSHGGPAGECAVGEGGCGDQSSGVIRWRKSGICTTATWLTMWHGKT
jgi:hypothetical protein